MDQPALTNPALTNGDYEALWGDGMAVAQAAGMVTVQLGVSIDEATSRLHVYANTVQRSLIDVARDVVARRLRMTAGSDSN